MLTVATESKEKEKLEEVKRREEKRLETEEKKRNRNLRKLRLGDSGSVLSRAYLSLGRMMIWKLI